MIFFRQFSLHSVAVAACGVIVAGELGCLGERVLASRAGARRLQQKAAEWRAAVEQVPPPSRAVARAIEEDLGRARGALAAMQRALKGVGPAAEHLHAARVPAARTDAYFDLVSFVEHARELARNSGVEVGPEAAQFGFAAHVHEAPETERIPVVFRQRQVVQFLAEALFEARPRTLVSVKREFPLTPRERAERDAALAAARGEGSVAAAAPAGGADFFAIDPRTSVRAPGVLEATAFRLTFIGQTSSLRAFLNRLARFELPVLVRDVRVEPAGVVDAPPAPAAVEDAISGGLAMPEPASVVLTTNSPVAPRANRTPPVANAVAPIVARVFSRFTVTVEYVELVSPPPEAAPAPSPTA